MLSGVFMNDLKRSDQRSQLANNSAKSSGKEKFHVHPDLPNDFFMVKGYSELRKAYKGLTGDLPGTAY